MPAIAGMLALGAVAGVIAVSQGKNTAADNPREAAGNGLATPGVRPSTTDVAASPAPSLTRPPTSASALASATAVPSASAKGTGRANPRGTNLALHRRATASSVESNSWPATAAVDGSMESRWSSGFADPQWIKVDLGEVWAISDVRLAWEHAYAVSYRVDVSVDGRHWSTVYRTTTGTDGTRDIPVSAVPARYVRVYGTKRVSQYGYSLQEIEVR